MLGQWGQVPTFSDNQNCPHGFLGAEFLNDVQKNIIHQEMFTNKWKLML